MAYLAEINPPRSPAERRALEFLSAALPASWVITTNIYEHNFEGRNKPEIDSIIVSPSGVYVVDFKNWKGEIIPRQNANWIVDGVEREETPLVDAYNDMFAIKDLLKARLGVDAGERIRLEPLVVFTNKSGILDWSKSDTNGEARLRIVTLEEVADRIKTISQRQLKVENARAVLEALKPTRPIPQKIFAHEDWGQRFELSVDLGTQHIGQYSPPGGVEVSTETDHRSEAIAHRRLEDNFIIPKESVAAFSPKQIPAANLVIDLMFQMDELRTQFSEYLRYLGRADLVSKRVEDQEKTDLDFLRRAREQFDARLSLLGEFLQKESYQELQRRLDRRRDAWRRNLSVLATVCGDGYVYELNPRTVADILETHEGFNNLNNISDPDRKYQIFKDYVRKLFLRLSDADVNRLMLDYRTLRQITKSDKYLSSLVGLEQLRSKFRELNLDVWPITEITPESIKLLQGRIRGRWTATARVVLDFVPGAPWSSRSLAIKLLVRANRYFMSPMETERHAAIARVAEIIGAHMAGEKGLNQEIAVEVLTGSPRQERDLPPPFPA